MLLQQEVGTLTNSKIICKEQLSVVALSSNSTNMKPIIFKSASDNTYLYSPVKSIFMPISPDIARAIEEENINNPSFVYLRDNGYLENMVLEFDTRISGEHIREAISNLPQVVFEVTTACNMKCKYCCYGEGYTTFQNRAKGNLSFEKAKAMLDYISVELHSKKNMSTDTKFAISFYGGEPLLNINLIKQIVEYAKTLDFKGRRLNFSMTSNAIHLAEHMDYLKENDFHLLVSLDGSQEHNKYRIYPNDQETFADVISNLKKVQKKYPDWFKTIRFNSVYTNLSDVKEIIHFFRTEFNRIPTFSPLHSTCQDAVEYQTINAMMKDIVIPEEFEEDIELLPKNPKVKLVYDLIMKSSFNFFITENDMLETERYVNILPTGTCIPFSKRLFVDYNGGIHPCEKVCRDKPLGYVDTTVYLPFDQIADDYNHLLQKMIPQCKKCYRQKTCTYCLKERDTNCNDFYNKNRFAKLLSDSMSYIEQHPNIFDHIKRHLVIR